jgi:hypothetical protein
MISESQLQAALKTWNCEKNELPFKETTEPHLTSEELYKMARDNGIVQSEKIKIKHLSFCPTCLHKWSEWRKAISASEDITSEDESEAVMTHIYLEAAATTSPAEPLNVLSACGRFSLGLLPDDENPDKAMVTVDVAAGDVSEYNGWHISVSDKNRRILLEGALFDGRLARICENIGNYDFSEIKIVVTKSDQH